MPLKEMNYVKRILSATKPTRKVRCPSLPIAAATPEVTAAHPVLPTLQQMLSADWVRHARHKNGLNRI